MIDPELASHLIHRAASFLNTCLLVRGEHFLSLLGVHPKALEAFDQSGTASPRRHSVPSAYDAEGLKRIQQHPRLMKRIGQQVAAYPSAREYFISQLAERLVAAGHEGRTQYIVFRTTDFKSNELASLLGAEFFEAKERDPQMGVRGLRRYLSPLYRNVFDWELQACRRASSNGRLALGIVFPFVRDPMELQQGLARVAENNAKPTAIGMMIELPINIDYVVHFAAALVGYTSRNKQVPLFLIGLGDLIQFLMAAARDSPSMVSFHEGKLDVSVVRALTHAVTHARKFGISCGIHADMLLSLASHNPDFAVFLATQMSFLVDDHLLVN